MEEEKEAVKAGIERYQVDKSNFDNNVTCKYLGNFNRRTALTLART